MTSPRSLDLAGNSGLALHASHWPNAGRPICILLHGFGHDSRIWDPLSSTLHADYEVVALDFRGHGKSAWDSRQRYCHETLLEDLNSLVDHLQIEQFHLIGHSLGARIAMLYSARHPGSVLSLTIIDTGPEVGGRGVNRIREDAESLPRSFARRKDYFEWLCQRHPLAIRSSLEHRAEHGLRYVDDGWQPRTDPGFARSLWRQDASGNGADDLRHPLTEELWDCLDNIGCKTLVLRGQISSILKYDVARVMAEQRLARGTLESVPMAGHAVMLDNPQHCSAAISRFLADTRDTSDDRCYRSAS